MSDLPKSYATDADREGLTQNAIYCVEAYHAWKAEDEETYWKWLALAELPGYALMAYKKTKPGGAEIIRARGLNTADADRVYGPGWLDA